MGTWSLWDNPTAALRSGLSCDLVVRVHKPQTKNKNSCLRTTSPETLTNKYSGGILQNPIVIFIPRPLDPAGAWARAARNHHKALLNPKAPCIGFQVPRQEPLLRCKYMLYRQKEPLGNRLRVLQRLLQRVL